MTAETFTRRLAIKRVLQAKNLRSFHAHAHYVAQMKKIWRHHVSKIRCMFEDCDMDIGYLVDVMLWYQCIVALGHDDKKTFLLQFTVQLQPLLTAKYVLLLKKAQRCMLLIMTGRFSR